MVADLIMVSPKRSVRPGPPVALDLLALAGELEERGAQDEPRGQHQDQPGDDDTNKRPALAPRRLPQRLDEDPAQEAGRAERQQADGHEVEGTADDPAAVV